VPDRGEDVGEEEKVGFMFFAGRELERIEVGLRHPYVLGLATAVGAHGDVAVWTWRGKLSLGELEGRERELVGVPPAN
jgi:hypothetical protein